VNRISEARLQFELVLRTNKLANALLPQRRCLSMPSGLNHRKGGGDDSIPSRKSLSDMMHVSESNPPSLIPGIARLVSAVVHTALLAQDNDAFPVTHLLNKF